jgi:Amt family ammonium transporter
MDACLGSIVWYIIGYPLAYGSDAYGFIGTTWDVMGGCASYADWLFQWAFAAAAATIVSGAVAERCTFHGYTIYTCVITAFIYPPVVHWGWTSAGWLASRGFKDFAGSCLVHMVGGFSSLMAAIAIGPRYGRFTPDGVAEMHGHSSVLAVLGVFCLWFGWYGFNGVSTLSFFAMNIAARVMMTTTLSAAAGGSITMLIHVLHGHHPDVGPLLNGILAGLVSVTAPCALIEPWMAIVVGVVGGAVYYYSSWLLKKLRIDDPLDAFPVHGCCGMWATLAVGLLTAPQYSEEVYNDTLCYGAFYGSGCLLGIQIAGIVAVASWTSTLAGMLFFGLRFAGWLRVPVDEEIMGLDVSHHGGAAYHHAEEVGPMKESHSLTNKVKVTPI